MLIRRATLLDGTRADIRVGDRIAAVAGQLDPLRGEEVYDAAGATVIPGLHDHHVHLYSAAAALISVRVGPDEVRGRDELARTLAAAEVGPGVISEGLGGWNVTYAQMTEDDLTPGQRRILRRYAHQVPVITI